MGLFLALAGAQPSVVRAVLMGSVALLIREGVSGYWGDLHGQSGESIGVTTSRQYFDFARNKAFLDVSAHGPISSQKLAILAALNIADDYFRAMDEAREQLRRMNSPESSED